MDVFCLEDLLWIVAEPTGSPTYDFAFEQLFRCARPLYRPDRVSALARVGARVDYQRLFDTLAQSGVDMLHTPDIYYRRSDLRGWYPLLADLTARTQVYDAWPVAEKVGSDLGWPVFVKGVRQTSRHRLQLAWARSPVEFEALGEWYRTDRILSGQPIACRQWLHLRK
jgi:hypothetical protein